MAQNFLSDIKLGDDIYIRLGDATNGDLQIYHDGSYSYIDAVGTGDFRIRSSGAIALLSDSNEDMVLAVPNGAVSLYYNNSKKFETTSTGISVTGTATTSGNIISGGHVYLTDGNKLLIGSGEDLQVLHDGTNSTISNQTGDLQIINHSDDKDIVFYSDDGSGNITEYFRVDGDATNVLFSRKAKFSDNVEAVFGDGADLKIYHDGSDSIIADTGTGGLKIQVAGTGTSGFYKYNTTEVIALFEPDGPVSLYYNNSKKFETSNAGVVITGNAYLTSGSFVHFDNGGSNNYAIRKQGTTLEFRTGGTYNFLSGNATFAGNVLPAADSTYDLGTNTVRWRNVYADNYYGDGSNLTGVAADESRTIILTVKNKSGGSLSKGTLVHASPSATPPSGNVIEVIAAENDVEAKMPALGVLNETLADEAEGECVVLGSISGISTTDDGTSSGTLFSIGDFLYVSDTAGLFTNVKPTGTKLIQKIGIVIKAHATNGTVEIFGAGRTNDVPTPLYIDHANQRVGVGATDPLRNLHVVGNFAVNAATNQYYGVYISGAGEGADPSILIGDWHNDSATLKWDSSARSLNIDTQYSSGAGTFNVTGNDGASTFLTIDSSGKVGIGTTSPQEKLHVNGGHLEVQNAGNTNIYINAQAGSDATLWFQEGGGAKGKIQNDASNDSILITDGANADTMTLKGQKVGIGTTTPGQKLEVAGRIRVTTDPTIEFYESSSKRGGIQWDSTNDYTNIFAVGGDIRFDIGGEKMRIDSSGNVGINNSDPAKKLEISSGTDGDGILLTGTGSFGNGHSRNIEFSYNDSDTSYASAIKFVVVDASAHGGQIEFFTDNSSGTETRVLTLDKSQNATFAGDVTVTGDLIVSGSETILNTETVQVEDNIIQLNRTPGSPNDTATAATSGISIYRGDGVTQASFIFDDGDDTWDLTNNLTVAGDVTTDKIKGATYPSNSFLDFDYDQTAASNTTALTSIARINYIADTNGNDGATSAGHVFYTGTTDIDTATELLVIKNNGDATFTGSVTVSSGGIDVDGNSMFDDNLRVNGWIKGASDTNTLYSSTSLGTLLQTPGNTAGNNNSKIFFRDNLGNNKHTFDTNNGNATFAGDVTVNGGDFNLTKQNGSPVITMLHDGNNPSTNTLLHHLDFQVDYAGNHQSWGSIQHKTTGTDTRTQMIFNVKSQSGNVMDALTLTGGSGEPSATFAGTVTVDGGQILTPSGVNLALNPNTGVVSVGGVIQASGTGNNTFAGVINANGGINVTGNIDTPELSINDYVKHNGNTNTYFGFPSADHYKVVTGGSDALTLDSSQNATFAGAVIVGTNDILLNPSDNSYINSGFNFGIGETSPSAPLHVIAASSSNDALIQRWGYTSGSSSYQLDLKQTVTSGVVRYNFSMVNNNTAYNDVLVLDRGNVGIGETSPTHVLHVHSDTDNDYVARFEGSTNNGAGVWTGIGIGGEAANTKSAIIFEDIGASYSRGKLHLAVNNETNQNSATKADAKLTVNNDGYIGIGTTSPLYKLDVNQGASSTAGITTPFRVSGGTMSASGDGTAILLTNRYDAVAGGDYGGYMRIVNTQGSPSYLNPRLEFGVQNNNTNAISDIGTKMTILGTGKVGIGTDSPSAKLQVGAEQNSNATGISLCAGSSVGNLIARTTTHHNWFPYSDGNNYYSAGTHTFRNASHSANYLTLTSSLATFAGNITAGNSSTAATIRAHYDDGAYVDHTGFGLEFARNASYIRPVGDGTRTMYFGTNSATWNTIAFNSNSYSFQKDGNTLLTIDEDGQVNFNGYGGADGFALPDVTADSGYSNISMGGLGFLYRNARDSYITQNTYYSKVSGANGWRAKYGGYGGTVITIDHGFTVSTAAAVTNSGDTFSMSPVFDINESGDVDFSGSLETEGPDGGLVLRYWQAGASYGMLGTKNMANSEYAVLTDGTHTYLSGGSGGNVYIRAGNNDSTHQLAISSTGATFNGEIHLVDSNTKILEGSGNAVKIQTNSGSITIGPQNSLYAHISTDKGRFYFNKRLVVDEGTISSYNEDLKLRRGENDYDSIQIKDTNIGFFLDNAEDMRLENDGDLHVEGDVIAYSTTVSDNRLKDDVVTIDSALDKVSKLRGVEYTWNATSREGQKDIGVIAQEVEEVIPEIVREKKMSLVDGEKYKTVDYEKLTAVLIEAVKELKEEVEELKNKCNDCTC